MDPHSRYREAIAFVVLSNSELLIKYRSCSSCCICLKTSSPGHVDRHCIAQTFQEYFMLLFFFLEELSSTLYIMYPNCFTQLVVHTLTMLMNVLVSTHRVTAMLVRTK